MWLEFYVFGESLASQLNKKNLPLEDTLKFNIQTMAGFP